jgi:hypothetical protein
MEVDAGRRLIDADETRPQPLRQGEAAPRSSGACGERLSIVRPLPSVPLKQEVAGLRFCAPDPQASRVLDVRRNDAFRRGFVSRAHGLDQGMVFLG